MVYLLVLCIISVHSILSCTWLASAGLANQCLTLSSVHTPENISLEGTLGGDSISLPELFVHDMAISIWQSLGMCLTTYCVSTLFISNWLLAHV